VFFPDFACMFKPPENSAKIRNNPLIQTEAKSRIISSNLQRTASLFHFFSSIFSLLFMQASVDLFYMISAMKQSPT
jgi:hypothetical protein